MIHIYVGEWWLADLYDSEFIAEQIFIFAAEIQSCYRMVAFLCVVTLILDD